MARTHLPLSGAFTLAILGYGANALAVDCYIDSVAGDDSKNASSEADAVKTQAKIPTSCTVIHYKRGSAFNEAVKISGSNKTYTNYGNSCDPLPKFVMPGTKNTGAVVSAYSGGITVDGLSLANSHGDGSSASFSTGVCVSLGSNSIMQNCEITSCDIGVMMSGTGSKFINNYVHDLNTMIVDASVDSGVNINSVGGAEGIFVNGSNNEVAYNQFINCTTVAAWTGGSCDGGATEVAVGNNSTVSGVKIHHNFAYNTCGFFEASSGTAGGTFADSEFYDNISVDSGWMFLFQINNTTFSNIRWENNTIVYHKSSGTTYAPSPSMIYNGTGTTGGAATGTLTPNTVYFQNNLVLYDGFSSAGTLDKNLVTGGNLVTTSTSGVVKSLGSSAVTPAATDFDLIAGSPAIDQGITIANITSDYLNRAMPDSSGKTDIGAFEYNSSTASGQAAPVATMDLVLGRVSTGCTTTGGAGSTGGSSSVVAAAGGAPSTGGSSAKVTGGSPSTGGSAPKATGGANNPVVTGGAQGTGGSVAVDAGGSPSAGGAASTGGAPASNTGGASQVGAGGDQPNAGGAGQAGAAQGGDNSVPGSNAVGGASVVATTSPVNTNGTAVDQGACTCRVVGRTSQSTSAAAWFALLMLGWGIRRNRRNSSS